MGVPVWALLDVDKAVLQVELRCKFLQKVRRVRLLGRQSLLLAIQPRPLVVLARPGGAQVLVRRRLLVLEQGVHPAAVRTHLF